MDDGLVLIALFEALRTQKDNFKSNKNPKMRVARLENTKQALKFLIADGVKLVNIDAQNIVDGDLKVILGLLYAVILKNQISQNKADASKNALVEWVNSKVVEQSTTRPVQFHSFFILLCLASFLFFEHSVLTFVRPPPFWDRTVLSSSIELLHVLFTPAKSRTFLILKGLDGFKHGVANLIIENDFSYRAPRDIFARDSLTWHVCVSWVQKNCEKLTCLKPSSLWTHLWSPTRFLASPMSTPRSRPRPVPSPQPLRTREETTKTKQLNYGETP